jgi:hypothetical protein
MLASALKIVGASILTIAIAWALVLGWWQTNDYQPSSFDLLLYLGALPLSMIGGFLLLKGFIDHIKNPPTPSPSPGSEAKDSDPLTSAAAKTAAAERSYTIALVGASVITGPAASGAEILDAVSAGLRPQTDSELQDDAGFPVFAARVGTLDDARLGEWLVVHEDSLPKNMRDGEQARALALIDLALPPLLTDARQFMEQALPAAKLRVLWLVPSTCERDHFPALQAWLRSTYLSDIDKTRIEVSVRPVATEADALKEIDELILAIQREQLEKDLHLVIGATSHVGERTIQAWSSQNRLFTPDRQNGQVPGECAVCLLFTGTTEDTAGAIDDGVQVSRISSATRDKPVNANGRISSALLEQLISGLMTIRGIEASDIKKVIADGDHRANWVTELMNAVGEQFKELAPIDDCHSIGMVCGAIPPLGSLVALACCREKVLAEDGKVICLSTQDAVTRAALVVEPIPSPAGTVESATRTS